MSLSLYVEAGPVVVGSYVFRVLRRRELDENSKANPKAIKRILNRG